MNKCCTGVFHAVGIFWQSNLERCRAKQRNLKLYLSIFMLLMHTEYDIKHYLYKI